MPSLIERLTLDPLTEDPTLQPLDLVGLDASWGIFLLTHEYPPPPQERVYATNADMEGDALVQARYQNRLITVRVRVIEPADAASTNLSTNPTAALATTGWGGNSLAAGPTRVVPTSLPGNTGADTAVEAKTDAAGDYVYHEVAVTNAKTYRASIYVQLRAKTSTAQLRVVVYNAAGAALKASGTVKVSTVDTEGWTRLDVGFTADATATWRVGVEQLEAGTATLYATALLVEEATTLGAYFDGNSPGCDWSGTDYGSASTRPAPDGTRFSRIMRDLTRKLDRIKRQRSGTLRRYSALGQALTYDLMGAEITEAPQDTGIARRRAEVAMSFEAEPGGRGPEQLVESKEETTLPALVLVTNKVPGELPGLGRLVVSEKQAVGQAQLVWGQEQRYYSASANAALFYEAESRTLLSGSSTSAVPTEPSGGSTVLNGALVNVFQPVFSTQASGGGAHLSHIGTFRIIARTWRPTTNTGQVSVKLSWRQGDFISVNENPQVVYGADDREGQYCLTDLGEVTIEPPPAGTTSRWEGRVMAASTVSGDDLYVDCFLLVPVPEGSGEVTTPISANNPGAFVASDSFDYPAEAALAGKVAPLGGTWGGGGDADDFKVGGAFGTYGPGTIFRAPTGADAAGTGRWNWLSETKYTGASAHLIFRTYTLGETDFATYGNKLFFGAFMRYVDTNNWLAALLSFDHAAGGLGYWRIEIWKRVGGAKTLLGAVPLGGYAQYLFLDVDLTLIASGTSWAVLATTAAGLGGQALGTDPVLATTLKEGRIGVYAEQQTTAWSPENGPWAYSFEAQEAALDQVLFASRTLELRSDQVRRQDSGGTTWGKLPYEGDYLLVPPAGPEQLTNRFIVKASRSPDADGGIDDLKADLYVTPRYLYAPPT